MSRLLNHLSRPADALFYTQRFRRELEFHMAWLRNHPDTIFHPVEAIKAVRFKGDLYGYLTEQAIPVNLHWVIMRMNEMRSTTDFNEDTRTLMVPSEAAVYHIRDRFRTVQKKMA